MKKFNGTPNLTGRPKGAVNKTTAEAKALLQIIVNNELETIQQRLEQLDNKERIDAVIKLLPYIVPRQTEIAVETKTEYQPITVHILTEEEIRKIDAELESKY
jgi:23S rRNA C2498 (ribose-2'-O)-methylase RlmM